MLPVLLALALLPAAFPRALRERPSGPEYDESGSPPERIPEALLRRPALHLRPPGLSPRAGVPMNLDLRELDDPETLFTPTGVFRVSDPDGQEGFPEDLRRSTALPGPGAGVRPGDLNYALLTEAGRMRSGEVEVRIAGLGGRIVGFVRNGYVLWVPGRGLEELVSSGLFRAFSPVPPAHRIAPDLGVRPLLEKKRAEAAGMRLLVEVVSGVEDPGSVERILATGSRSVRPLPGGEGRDRFEVIGDTVQVRRLAGLPWVISVREEPEFLLQNYETVPQLQVGSWEDREFERPFWAAGLDGRGQIVAVSDGGLSLDSPMFSDTATDPGDIGRINSDSLHRKLVLYEPVLGDVQACDSPASGGRTHGNVVAGIIAGNAAADFGFTVRFQPNRPEVLAGIDLDGLAKGARIAFQDIGTAAQCRLNELVEVGGNVTVPGGNLGALLASARDRGANLHVLPFGVPNFDSTQFADCGQTDPCAAPVAGGLYTAESEQVDRFLAGNLDYMVFLPAGNNGGVYPRALGRLVDLVPDAADGDVCNENVSNSTPGYTACPAPVGTPAAPIPLMIPAPATAKNDITVGSGRIDCGTGLGDFNCEEAASNFTSKGPEGRVSLRTGPTILAPGHDDSDFLNGPNTWGIAVLGSTDDDQDLPVQGPRAGLPLKLDDGNTGTSFAAASATAAGAIVRQYFADGFYPTGEAVPAHAVLNVSGALVKAMLIQMTNFLDATLQTVPSSGGNDVLVASNRCGTGIGKDSTGRTIGVVGNFEQGCGRPVLAQGLPLVNYPATNVYPLVGPGTPEHPAAGLVVYDFIATPDPDLGLFTAANASGGGDSVILQVYGPPGQLRCALAWIDPPSASASDPEGMLINDLDLTLTSPDGTVYRGNVYSGPWSTPNPGPTTDTHNPFEAVHVDAPAAGAWTLAVTATKAPIGNSGANEDADGDFRLDPGEDLDSDGILDLDGQPYAIACSGPILTPAQLLAGGGSRPGTGNRLQWDRSEYSCREDAVLRLFDGTVPAPGAVAVSESIAIEVRDAAGRLVDTETAGFFPSGAGFFVSRQVGTRRSGFPVHGNGLLEVEDGHRIEATYLDADALPGRAVAGVRCRPNLLASVFGLAGETDRQAVVSGGCDADPFLDAGEVVTFSVAVCNDSPRDAYREVRAVLEVTGGPAAPFVEVVEPEIRVGDLPAGPGCGVAQAGSGFQGVSFALQVDPGAEVLVEAGEANGWVELTLRLQAQGTGRALETESFPFRVAVVADKEIRKYSTDHPEGTGEIAVERDIDRDGLITTDADADNLPDILDASIAAVEERVIFDPIPRIPPSPTHTGNTCNEDADGDGLLDPGEDLGLDGIAGTGDIGENNGILDRCLYGDPDGTSGTADDFIPWGFDGSDGGMSAVRDPITDTGIPVFQNAWENIRTGYCGFQTAIPDGDAAAGFQNLGAGVWHTGNGLSDANAGNNDGVTTFAESQANNADRCRRYSIPTDPSTAPATEIVVDVLNSPLIPKVNQEPDARGLPWMSEFRRLAFNTNIRIPTATARLDIDIDS
ncbi:MAG: S8 family serine peptidase, partial [Acidobacteria bacterium]|nr:S8 family serine peptidase [Acidobacteriota bacterium]